MLLLQAPFALTGVAFIVIEILLARSSDIRVQVLGKLVDLRGGVALGMLILVASLLAAMGYMTRVRGVLYLSQALTILSIAGEMAFGLYVWYSTLETKKNWARIWTTQLTVDEIVTLQDLFKCCGYYDYATPTPFSVSNFCTDAASAASKPGCVGAFAQQHARPLLNLIFTGTFAMTVGSVIALMASFVFAKQCSRLVRVQRRRELVVEELMKKRMQMEKM